MKRYSISVFPQVIAKLGIIALIFLSVSGLKAQTVNLDSLPVVKLMYVPAIDTLQFSVRNLSEDSILQYQSHIEYKRTQNAIVIQDSLLMSQAENLQYDTLFQYVDTAFLSNAYGNQDNSQVTVATQYTAGENGFNLSDVGTWFISGNDTTGIIQVEIRAGGNTIEDAVVVSQGSVQYETANDKINGQLYNIHLNKEITLYPNENFYVIFTYPGNIERPQGCAVNDSIASAEGRYLVEVNNQFVDLQQTDGYANGAWLMYAAESSPNDIGWLSIIGNASGTVHAQDSTFIQLQLNGLIANLGSQYADVVILSNDSVNPEVRMPVELRLNEAPFFIDAPTDISVKEGATAEINIIVKDLEGDPFTISPVMGAKFVQFTVSDSILTLDISPEKGFAGDYTVIYSATDVYGMSRELTITIHVLPNQPPVFINPPAEISTVEDSTLDVQITASDPENDAFVISLTDSLSFITSLFSDTTLNLHFFPQVGDAGDYTLHLTAQDTTGSVSTLTIPLHVAIKNRPPVLIGSDTISFSFLDNAKNFNISDYFMDPDSDAFTFDVSCLDPNVVKLTTDNTTSFSLQPLSVGTTQLNFTLTDARGAQSQYSIKIIVGQCSNHDGIIIQKWNKVLLVNNYTQEYDSTGYQWYRNGIAIKNATGQYYSSEDDTGGMLDFTAEYFVRMIKVTGDTVYTCPFTPVQTTITAKAYPNPVLKGTTIHVESESTGSGNIQIIDISGHVMNTIQTDQNVLTIPAPDIAGVYLLKVVYGNKKNVFRIKVY